MTAFARPSLLDNRYADIAETSVFTYDDDDLVNYADFLRKHGRYMTKNGFVDSSRRVRSLHRQQDDITPTSRSGLFSSVNKSTKKPKTSESLELPSVISISTNLETKKKEHDKQMRLIEEQMIKSKQTERESKRLEGDVKKEQRYLNHTLKELDVDVIRKRIDAEKNLNKNLEEKDRIERDFLRKREQQSKQRTERTIDRLQSLKDKDRRNDIVCNDLARQYRTKATELESKHQQLAQLHNEFETRVQQKELEENRIKKELGEIAMALNLEAQKAKNDMHDFVNIINRDRTHTIKHDLQQERQFDERLNQTSIHVKNYDLERRRLSADVTLHRSMLDLKQREALRRIVDTKNRLETIYTKQRDLNKHAAIAEQDRRAAELMTKMTDVENRRSQLASQSLRVKIEKSEVREAEGASKAKVRHAEIETREHEDHLRHFQKIVSKNEELEHDLRKSVKDAEFDRRKKEQEIQTLETELIRKKHSDSIRIRDEIARAEREEKELEQHLIQEKSKLEQLHVKREDQYLRLLKQREQIRETKILLQAHQREHERLLRVHARSQSLQSLNTV